MLREPRIRDFDSLEEYQEALDAYYAAIDDAADRYHEERMERAHKERD